MDGAGIVLSQGMLFVIAGFATSAARSLKLHPDGMVNTGF